MGAKIDFWYEFASTYSYLAAERIRELARGANIGVRFRPFLLGPIFKAQGWTTSPFNLYEAKGRYMWRDLARQAALLGLPFKRPEPFPQNALLAARLAVAGLAHDWGEDFSLAVYRAEFGAGRSIEEPEMLRDILMSLKIDPQSAFAEAQSDQVKKALRAQTDEAQRLGIFGAPTFITPDGELFWGNDRLEQAVAWTKARA